MDVRWMRLFEKSMCAVLSPSKSNSFEMDCKENVIQFQILDDVKERKIFSIREHFFVLLSLFWDRSMGLSHRGIPVL